MKKIFIILEGNKDFYRWLIKFYEEQYSKSCYVSLPLAVAISMARLMKNCGFIAKVTEEEIEVLKEENELFVEVEE